MSGDNPKSPVTPGGKSPKVPRPGGKNQKVQTYAERMIERAKTLQQTDAFAPSSRQIGTLISAAQAKATTAMHGRNSRRTIAAFVVALVVVVLVSLCLPYRGINTVNVSGSISTPADVLAAYQLWFQLNVASLFDPALANHGQALVSDFDAQHGQNAYRFTLNRVAVTFLVILCGIMLALSGLLFQATFRNPLAAPTMLGVSDGVTLGMVIYCMMGYASIDANPGLYAALAYGLGAVMVVVVLLFSRVLSGGRRYNILDMLLLGTVICQLIGGINQFFQYFIMTDDQWANFFDIQQATDALTEPILQVLVVGIFVITFVLAFSWRFKFNLVSFSDEEATLMGVRVGLLRAFALVLGSVMELAAIASIGQVAMLSLAVPFLVRYLMDADFKTQFLGNCLIGSVMLLVCMVVQHFFTIGIITIPLGTIVSVVIVPFFVWIVAFAQGKWV